MEKARQCLKALERENIAKGMFCTKEDERKLREMQKTQMEEKRFIEKEEEMKEWMWHQLLLDQVHREEQYKLRESQRMHQEMLERRMAYDEQIASANRKRQQVILEEREKENRRLEIMKKKMEQDHFEAIKRKKEKQMENKLNFIKGHEMKLSRLEDEQLRDRMIDEGTIRVALEGLRKEREKQKIQMQSLKREKQICIENYYVERKLSSALREEAEEIADEWKRLEESKTDEYLKKMEEDKLATKKKEAAAYKEYITQRNIYEKELKQLRAEKMVAVNRNALKELEKKMSDADAEIKKQIAYRRNLTEQINENHKHVETEMQQIEEKDKAFTKQRIMFRDAMEKRYGLTQGRQSTNPLHPFRRLMESNQSKSIPLPEINLYK